MSHDDIEDTIDYIIHADDFEELLEKIFFIKKAQLECFDYIEDQDENENEDSERNEFRDACFGHNSCEQLCFNQVLTSSIKENQPFWGNDQ